MLDRITRNFEGEPWLRLCRSGEVQSNRGARAEIDIEYDLAIFRIGDEVFATSNVCPHKRAAILYDGYIEHGTVTCPLHGWKYDIRTGQACENTSKLSTYPVMERDGWIWVKVSAVE